MRNTRSGCVKRLTLFGIAEFFPLKIITVKILNARFNFLRYTNNLNPKDAVKHLKQDVANHYHKVFCIEPCSLFSINELIAKELKFYQKKRSSENRDKKQKSNAIYFDFERKIDFQRGGSKNPFQDFRNVSKPDFYMYQEMLDSSCSIMYAKTNLEYTKKLQRKKMRTDLANLREKFELERVENAEKSVENLGSLFETSMIESDNSDNDWEKSLDLIAPELEVFDDREIDWSEILPILARFGIPYEAAQEFISAHNRALVLTDKRYFISDSTIYRYMVLYRKMGSEQMLERIQAGHLYAGSLMHSRYIQCRLWNKYRVYCYLLRTLPAHLGIENEDKF